MATPAAPPYTMNYPEQYARRAEDELKKGGDVARAQVYATLAQAAATIALLDLMERGK